MSEGPGEYPYRSRGRTRRVLVAMERAPNWCWMLGTVVVSVLTMPLTFWLLDRATELVGRVGEWLF